MLYTKLPEIVKKLENCRFFQYLGHSEETFDHKLGLFENVLRALFYQLEFFEAFLTEMFQSPKKNY